ncbi:hypothetical protein DERP_001445 [Dermatophagoides pteronyssinus]|uniref:Uncharacterized protein n=1 Tax=Dermatophagoides pteronyssinus TaxID=6956 RepID=A0ABQ8JEH2_DERPT|nr:hypothetical protein DERP_001445 [Dermatophagoides pteronyssinus]
MLLKKRIKYSFLYTSFLDYHNRIKCLSSDDQHVMAMNNICFVIDARNSISIVSINISNRQKNN